MSTYLSGNQNLNQKIKQKQGKKLLRQFTPRSQHTYVLHMPANTLVVVNSTTHFLAPCRYHYVR